MERKRTNNQSKNGRVKSRKGGQTEKKEEENGVKREEKK